MSGSKPGNKITKVAVVRTSPLSVLADYARVMRLADYRQHLAIGKKNLIKINLSWRHWYPAASTAPWQLDGVLRALAANGYDPRECGIIAGHKDSDWLHEAMIQNGLDIAAAGGSPVPFPQNPELLQGSNIIHLPVMKTHATTGLDGAGMSVHDAFGAGRQTATADIHEQIVDSLVQQGKVAAGSFTVMDGALAGDGPGPRTIIPYEKDYLLAGADPVAVDAVAAHMMGFEPMEIGYIRIATQRGLGQGDISRIELVGEDIRAVDFHFTGCKPGMAPSGPAQYAGSRLGGLLPGGLPLSEQYLEYLWYPFRGWPRIGRVAESEWGQLLQQYLPEGAELERQGSGKGPALAALSVMAALVGWSAARLTAGRGKAGA